MVKSKLFLTSRSTLKRYTSNLNMNTFITVRSIIFVFVFCGVYFSNSHSSYAEKILIFAASSLTLPLQKIANTFQQETHHNVRISFVLSLRSNGAWMNYGVVGKCNTKLQIQDEESETMKVWSSWLSTPVQFFAIALPLECGPAGSKKRVPRRIRKLAIALSAIASSLEQCLRARTRAQR